MNASDSRFARNGFAIFNQIISPQRCEELGNELSSLFDSQQKSAKNRIGGVRNLLQTNKLVTEIANCDELKSILRHELGADAFAVRSIFFDKTPEANWLVPWHQDLAVVVKERIETMGFGGWSLKGGIPHVHPPREILENMVTIRLHLDDCNADNGALKVIPESHRHGKLGMDAINERTKLRPFICETFKGDILLMRPLLLHASSPASSPAHRRVLHLEYATQELPNGLKWFER